MIHNTEVVTLGDGSAVRLTGHLDTLKRHGGIRPIRLPHAAYEEFPFIGYDNMRTVVENCSGIHISFETEATSVDLTVRCTRVDYGDLSGVMSIPGVFVACVDGKPVGETSVGATDVERLNQYGEKTGEARLSFKPATVHIDGLPAGGKKVVVWLPQAMIVDLIGISADAPIRPTPDSDDPMWLHYGSSISHCHTADRPTSVWPVVAAGDAGLNITNLGFAGQCMLDPFVAKAIAHTPADVISLSVGINIVGARSMDVRTFIPALHGFLDTIREGHPDTPIVLVSSIFWPNNEDIPGPSDVRFNADNTVTCYAYGDPKDIPKGAMTLSASRDQIAKLVTRRRAHDPALYYLDGLELYGPHDVVQYPLPDGLHPGTELYIEMGHRFARKVFSGQGLVPVSALSGVLAR